MEREDENDNDNFDDYTPRSMLNHFNTVATTAEINSNIFTNSSLSNLLELLIRRSVNEANAEEIREVQRSASDGNINSFINYSEIIQESCNSLVATTTPIQSSVSRKRQLSKNTSCELIHKQSKRYNSINDDNATAVNEPDINKENIHPSSDSLLSEIDDSVKAELEVLLPNSSASQNNNFNPINSLNLHTPTDPTNFSNKGYLAILARESSIRIPEFVECLDYKLNNL